MTKTRINLCYRAEFEQPTGALNPMGLKFAAPVPVEVFKRGTAWLARSPANGAEFDPITAQPSADAAKQQMKQYFKKQLTPWKPFDRSGNPVNPDLIETRPNGDTYLKELTIVQAEQAKR